MGTTFRQPLRKCRKLTHHVNEDDPFRWLPDEIIESQILPRLPLKEAVRTCILSRRWQKLWTHNLGPNLIFTHSCKRACYSLNDRRTTYLAETFANGINHVLETYCKPTLDELAVCFQFCSKDKNDVDSWVEYAFRKGVRRLELDFSILCSPIYTREHYAFPGIGKVSSLHNLYSMHNLKEVCLKYVDVTSEVIELMLSIFPSLEHLSVSHSSSVKWGLQVSGQSLKLKCLELVQCYPGKIVVSASSLMSLKYSGVGKQLCLRHVPLLSELSIGLGYCRAFLRKGFQNFSYISQLKKLKLEMCQKAVRNSICYPLEVPSLVNLEQMEVKMTACGDSCLLWPIVLIKAAPILHRISFEILTMSWKKEKQQPDKDHLRNLRKAVYPVHHQCLKVIEMHNFEGCLPEMELAQQLVGICESLEQFVIKPHLLKVTLAAPLKYYQKERKRADKLAGYPQVPI